jgi:hypothetical protein
MSSFASFLPSVRSSA